MSFLKLALPLSVAGLMVGLAVAFLITPRYVATAAIAFRGEIGGAGLALSNEEIAAIVESRRERLFEDEPTRMPYQSIAIVRNAIQISIDRPTGQSLNIIRIRATYRTQRGAAGLAYGIISVLLNKLGPGPREQALQSRLEQLKIRLAALQAHTPVPPPPPALPTSPEILDMPTVPQKPEFPNRWAVILAGGLLGFLLAIPLSRRKRYH